jgi:hypothetical protein
VQNDLCSTERKQLVDQHQVISIIATAICECFKERPEQEIGPEEAKQKLGWRSVCTTNLKQLCRGLTEDGPADEDPA